MEHLRVELEKAKDLGAKAVLEPRLAVHLHFQQHYRLLWRAGLAVFGPKSPVKAMVRRLELGCLKPIERIARRTRPELRSRRRTRRQQQRDQIRRALKQPVEPVIGFQGSPACAKQQLGTTKTLHRESAQSTCVLLVSVSVIPRVRGSDPSRRGFSGLLEPGRP
jgi:hypothetical protein